MRTEQHFQPGDYVAWYMGPTQIRGHIQKVLGNGDELVAISTIGVRWNLMPAYQQVDLLGPTRHDPIGIDR